MPVFRGDPCGITCLILTYVAIFYADYVIINWVVLQTMASSLWGALHVLLFNILIFMTIMAHVRAVFSDPGIVPLPQSRLDFSDMHSGGEKNDDWTVCARCEMYRPPRAHHCRICQRCIRRMDHHCPWINNCVGEWNQKYFLQFLIFVGLMSIYAMSLIAYSWIKACPDCSKDITVKQGRLLHSVILSMESILFGLFVIAIMWDQMQAILTDETAVEQLAFSHVHEVAQELSLRGKNPHLAPSVTVKRQGPYRARRPKMALLREVCGRSRPLLWIFPCTSAPVNIESSYNLTV